MTIELKGSFLGIPFGKGEKLKSGDKIVGDYSLDWGILRAALDDPFGDSFLQHVHTDKSREIEIVDDQTVIGPRGKERTVFTEEAVNRARLSVGRLIPGFRVRVVFK